MGYPAEQMGFPIAGRSEEDRDIRRQVGRPLRRRGSTAVPVAWLEAIRLPRRVERPLLADGLDGLVQRQPLVDLPPLPGVPQVGQVERAVAGVLQAGEGLLEGGRDGVGARAGVV